MTSSAMLAAHEKCGWASRKAVLWFQSAKCHAHQRWRRHRIGRGIGATPAVATIVAIDASRFGLLIWRLDAPAYSMKLLDAAENGEISLDNSRAAR